MLELFFEFREPVQEGFALGILRPEVAHQFTDGEAKRGDIDFGRAWVKHRRRRRVVELARSGSVEDEALGNFRRRNLQAHHVRETARAFEADGVFAGGNVEARSVHPLCAAGVPRTGFGAADRRRHFAVEEQRHRSRACGRVTDAHLVRAGSRKINVVFHEHRRALAKGDHRSGIRVIGCEGLRVAAVEGPGGDVE